MRALGDKTRALVEELYQPVPLVKRILGSSDRQREVIKLLGESGEISAVPYLLSFLLNSTTEPVAAIAICRLMEKASDRELVQLHEMRGYGSIYGYSSERYIEWVNLKPGRLSGFDYKGTESIWLLGLASFHGNGYVREAAVKRLASRSEPEALPFLLLRANDWVHAVRTRAKKALEKGLKREALVQFARALPFLVRLSEGRREDHGPFVQAVHDALTRETGLAALRDASRSGDRYVRRFAYKLVWGSDNEALESFVDGALNDPDVPIRVDAARYALASPQATNWLRPLKRDRVAAVRRTVLHHLAESDDAQDNLKPFLLDASAGLRSDARFYLRREGWQDFAPFYREKLNTANGQDLQTAIMGIGETGTAEDRTLVAPYLEHAKTKIRCAAVTALGRLGKVENPEPFLAALQDVAPSVSHAARDALLKGPLLPLDRLRIIAEESPHGHARKNAVRLLMKGGKWAAIRQLVVLSRSENAALRELALSGVDLWIARANRSFVSPSKADAAALQEAVAAADDALGRRGVEILACLKDWTR